MAKSIVIALLIIAIGVAWLLNTLHFIGGVDWIWTIALAAMGVITLVWSRINKVSFLIGCFLIIASVLSVLRQTGVLSLDVEVPILVIVFGLLFLVSQLPVIPLPRAMAELKAEASRQNIS